MVFGHAALSAFGGDTGYIMNQVYGQQNTGTTDDDYNTLSFVFWLLMQKVQTNTLVKVLSCTNDGGLAPVGRVTVQPCVNQMTGNRQGVPHGEIFNCLYSRITGGKNAIIMDPEEGDLGMMAFCSRDISNVVANAGPANPGSFRMFDWADGVFTMNVPLGVTPTQYVRFSDTDGIEIISPTKISIQAPVVNIGTADSATVDIGTNTTIDGKPFLPHTHEGNPPGSYVAGSTPVTGNSGPVT
jgi:hypothetical protein